MTTDIFIKTCKHDEAYHGYCMKSIERHCSGFRNTVVVDGEHRNGYIHQQVVKMHADRYTDADIICVTDSDTLFCRPTTPDDLLRDGRPMWLYTRYTPEMLAHDGLRTWKEVMTEFFGVEPEMEFMRRQPFVFPGWLLADLRAYCVKRHGRTMREYPFDKGRFTEWNILGFHAWLHHRDVFSWISTDSDDCPEPLVRQFWSHDPIARNLPEIERILA